MKYVVIDDLDRRVPPGTILDGQTAEVVSARRRVAMLPVDLDRVFTPASGTVYRPWGKGWAFDRLRAERGCPMAVVTDSDRSWVHWAASVGSLRYGEPMRGQLRLVADGSLGHSTAGMSQDVVAPPLDGIASGVVFGRSRLSALNVGVIGLSIYGVADNTAVYWSAVTISSEPAELPDAIRV